VTQDFERVSMHGVRADLARAQAEALGLPIREVRIVAGASNERYEEAWAEALHRARGEGIQGVVFGDLFLEDIRAYRERLLGAEHFEARFPVWGQNTATLARRFVADGFGAVLVCVDPAQIDREFCGRDYDSALLEDLPPSADPCGENGEFHTFVYDGPIFRHPVRVVRGEVVTRGGFVFCDLLPATA
jgi:uncharacterized protein (TIGR00290 family)